jgi:hypothetical protein
VRSWRGSCRERFLVSRYLARRRGPLPRRRPAKPLLIATSEPGRQCRLLALTLPCSGGESMKKSVKWTGAQVVACDPLGNAVEGSEAPNAFA